ncbi:MAG: MotA/TolQ/ExbB proton channel family protein [Nitrospiraceae bacterium]|nr:MotA/TolQ/ExbB proton channel family protein [Nitrospiraceae bacterium]MDA8324640.1 MotA/TolQ/ExbB proton channel family protein [Nitrospiraceae bacterium]
MVLEASLLVKLVVLLLLGFSVISWAVIIYKYKYLSRLEKQNEIFLRALSNGDARGLLAQARHLESSPIASVYRNVFSEAASGARLRRAIDRQEVIEAGKVEKYVHFLATTGSTTPFIGLFGTVWGIINAFRGIGLKGSASLAVVAPGIAEALITTAFGLVAAIPAVIAYNYYLGRTRRAIQEMESITPEIEALLSGRDREN